MIERDHRIAESVEPQRRLGRHIRHDSESWNYQAAQATTLRSVDHKRHGPIFDQGALGSCTGNALGAALMCEPLYVPGRTIDETVCRLIYSAGTRNDNASGAWPPTDTGSSGLGVCKAAKAVGMIRGYTHTFSLQAALAALVLQSGIIGINWYSSFDEPAADGVLEIASSAFVRGGHELVVRRVDVDRKLIGGDSSWGPGWGPMQGRWSMRWETFDRLLHEQGDVTFPLAA
jgi:hypothetical protein